MASGPGALNAQLSVMPITDPEPCDLSERYPKTSEHKHSSRFPVITSARTLFGSFGNELEALTETNKL